MAKQRVLGNEYQIITNYTSDVYIYMYIHMYIYIYLFNFMILTRFQ